MDTNPTYTAFADRQRIASGPLTDFLPALKAWSDLHPGHMHLVFEDATCKQVDFDLRGPIADVLERALPAERTGPGRPKLGVTSREISLLPRHWEWLEGQSGGASATLRRLVEQARKQESPARGAMDAACRFLSAVAGDFPDYEEATRAIYAGDEEAFAKRTNGWPEDVRAYALNVLAPAFATDTEQ